MVGAIFGGDELHQPEAEPPSRIIERLNERFGTNFAPDDAVNFYGTIAGMLTYPAARHPAGGGGQLAGDSSTPER